MNRLGHFDLDVNAEDCTAVLYEDLVTYPWFLQEVRQ